MYRNSLAGLLVAGLASLCGTAISQNAPDLILHNAIVWTVDDDWLRPPQEFSYDFRCFPAYAQSP